MSETKKAIVPETLDGWAVLHEMYRVKWPEWNSRPAEEKTAAVAEAINFFTENAQPKKGESGLFSILGHKGDLLLLHFRETLDELNHVELGFRQLQLFRDVEETSSYVSFVELGLYAMTVKLHEELIQAGLDPDSDEWKKRWTSAMAEQRERMKARIYPTIPEKPYLCFYPMDKKRGEHRNWYEVPIEKRASMMLDHGMIGRKYSGRVTQIISGSIGFDDWEWGVDLFAEDPKVFKQLIYEMRFDEASAHYALFGPFYTAIRLRPEQLKTFLEGRSPTV